MALLKKAHCFGFFSPSFHQVYIGGMHGDLCESYVVGTVDMQGHKLIDCCRQSLEAAISVCGPGVHFYCIGNTIE